MSNKNISIIKRPLFIHTKIQFNLFTIKIQTFHYEISLSRSPKSTRFQQKSANNKRETIAETNLHPPETFRYHHVQNPYPHALPLPSSPLPPRVNAESEAQLLAIQPNFPPFVETKQFFARALHPRISNPCSRHKFSTPSNFLRIVALPFEHT